MADPFNILAQQANQTAQFFQAIDRSTQQRFQNQFAVQEAETRLALNVAQQTEQYRMNDAKLKELDQMMQIRNQEMEWKAKDEAFRDTMRPLQFKSAELQYENQFIARTEQQLRPFMSDLHPRLADLTFENPALATEAQTRYNRIVYDISQKAIKDPSTDIQKELEFQKTELNKWIDKAKLTNKPKSELVFDSGVTGAITGTNQTPSWMAQIESAQKVEQKPEDVARAAGIYKYFGGSDAEFLKKHDAQYSKQIDSAYGVMMATGQVDEQAFGLLDPQRQQKVLTQIKQNDYADKLNKQIKSYQDEMEGLAESNKDGKYDPRIQLLANKIDQTRDLLMRDVYGVDPVTAQPNPVEDSDPNAKNAQNVLDAMSKSGLLPQQEDVAKIDALNQFDKIKGIASILIPSDSNAIKKLSDKIAIDPNSLDMKNMDDLLSGATEIQIAELARQPWFLDHLDKNNLTIQPVGGGSDKAYEKTAIGNAVDALTKDERPWGIQYIGKSEKRKYTQNDKKEATKVLKSALPKILLDYAKQK